MANNLNLVLFKVANGVKLNDEDKTFLVGQEAVDLFLIAHEAWMEKQANQLRGYSIDRNPAQAFATLVIGGSHV